MTYYDSLRNHSHYDSSRNHFSSNKKYVATKTMLLAQLDRARSWCECLLRHDLDSVDMSPAVLRQHLFELSEAIEVAFQIGSTIPTKGATTPFKKGRRS